MANSPKSNEPPFEPDSKKRYAHGGLKIFTLKGVPLRLDMPWFIVLTCILAWNVFCAVDAKQHLAAIQSIWIYVIVYGSLIVHEYGHVFAAMKLGIKSKNILVTWFGGVALIEKIPIGFGEFWITLWGPMMNMFIIGLAGLFQLIYTGNFLTPSAGNSFLDTIILVNLGLLIFNLIPAWPMDGGRLLRSLAWQLTKDDYKATLFAGRIAQVFSVLFMFAAYYMGLLLGLMGLFVLIFSTAELKYQAKLIAPAEAQKEEPDDELHVEELVQSEAPWTDDQVKSINEYQKNKRNYPLKGEKNCILIATRDGFVQEENGPIVQKWAFEFMTNWNWKAYADTMASLYGAE